jgi:hypothetical protein
MCKVVSKLCGFLKAAGLTIITIGVPVVFMLLKKRWGINFDFIKFDLPENLLTSIGIAIATILALAYSLSIISIQKASEAWTPEILEIYKQDKRTHVSVYVVCLFILVLFAIDILKLKNFDSTILGFVAVLFLAITLDWLRWYYKHVCDLLNPIEAVSKAKNEAIKIINSHPNIIGKHNVKSWLDSLSDIACKAILNKNSSTANTSIDAIKEVIKRYLEVNKTFSPKDEIINHVYESISRIISVAITSSDESSLINSTNIYLKIAALALKVNEQAITFVSLEWFMNSITMSQDHNLDNVTYQATISVAKMIKNDFPIQIVIDEIYKQIVDFYIDAIKFFLRKKSYLIQDVVNNLKDILLHLLEIEYKNSGVIISSVLEKIHLTISVAILCEKIDGDFFNLMAPLYASLYDLLEKAKQMGPTKLLEIGPNRIEPYSMLLEISEKISDQLLKQDTVDFQGSVLLIDMTQSVKKIFELFIDLIKKSIIGFDSEEAKNEIKKYLLFVSMIFKGDEKYAKSAYEIFVYVGIELIGINNEYQDVVIMCVDEIISFAVRDSNIIDDYGLKKVSNILVCVKKIRMASEKDNISELKEKIDKKLDEAFNLFESSQRHKLRTMVNSNK